MSDGRPDAYDREEWESEPYRDDTDERATPYRELSRVERDVLFALTYAVDNDRTAESLSAVADAVDERARCSSAVSSVGMIVKQLEDHGLVERHYVDRVGEATHVSITDAGLWALAERRDELQRAIRKVTTVTSEIEIPFNKWSKARLTVGAKTATTRTNQYGEARDRFRVADLNGRIRHYVLDDVRELSLREVAEEWYGAEGCTAPEKFRGVWRDIHPERGWEPERQVYLHLFHELTDDE